MRATTVFLAAFCPFAFGQDIYQYIGYVQNMANEATNAAAEATVTGLPFQTIQCTDPAVTNAAQNQVDRWRGVDTDTAIEEAFIQGFGNQDSSLTWAEKISNYFHGPEQMNCGNTADNDGCTTISECSDVNHPAGYFILNSLVTLHGMVMNVYDAIGRAQTQMNTVIGPFSSTFAPVDDPGVPKASSRRNWTHVCAPLKEMTALKEIQNEVGWAKDSINPMVSNGITIIKDMAPWAQATNQQNLLETYLGNAMTNVYETVSTLNTWLFNGSVTSVAMAYQFIDNGNLLETSSTLNDLDIQSAIQGAIYPYMIPKAWSVSAQGIHPFILSSGQDCSNPYPDAVQDFIDSDVAAATSVCYNNQMYYLLSATGTLLPPECGRCQVFCKHNKFPAPPGLSTLDGKAWGGVTRDDIVISAVNGYQANNNQNGWPLLDPSTDDGFDAVWNLGKQAAGVVQIPICDGETALANWAHPADGDPNYPCQPRSSKTKRELRRLLEKTRVAREPKDIC